MKRIIGIIIILVLVGGICVGVKGFIVRNGSGEGNQNSENTSPQDALEIDDIPVVIDEKYEDAKVDNSDIVTIRIEWDIIFIDDVKCESIDELKTKIIDSECKQVELIHKDAMKSTKDSVVEELKGIESALDIKINYNDN